MRIRQSVCYPAFASSEISLDNFCREVAAIGYEAIEIWGWDASLDELVATAKGRGLSVASISGHGSIEKGLNDEGEHERIEGELRRSIEKAAEHGIPGVICFSGSRHPSKSDLDGLATFVKGARRIVPYAEEHGVNLNLEILNSKVDHPGYQSDRVDWGIAACVALDSPRFKILFDIYHVQIMEGDVIRNLQKAMPFIGHIHTAGNPGRHDLDDSQELNYRPICGALLAAGYSGFVAHEFWTTGPDRFKALSAAFETCDASP